MGYVKGNHRNVSEQMIPPVKRIPIGAELADLQARLARLRRQTRVYPKVQPVAVVIGGQ